MRQILLASSAVSLLSIGAMPAQAQSAPGVKSGPQLEQIIVTATRRKENLQKTAISVTALSGAKLESAGVVQARDLSKQVAGLNITANGAGSQVYLRGVGTFTVNNYSSSPVATNLDAIYLGLPAFINGIFYDLSRVEVLKGPQGTLYGRNATAGAINVITNQPGPKFNGYTTFEAGNYGLFSSTAAVNVPVNDKLFVRVAGQVLNRDGYYADNTGRQSNEGFRVTALYKPTPDISLTVGADYQHASGEEEPLVPLGTNLKNPWAGPSAAYGNAAILQARNPADPYGVGLPPFFSSLLPLQGTNSEAIRNDNAGVHEDLEWDFGFTNLSLISSYRHLMTSWDTDPGFLDHQTDHGHQESVELRAASPASNGAWKWQGGVYYYANSADQSLVLNQGFLNPVQRVTNGDKSVAAFGETTYSITPRMRLTAGARLTDETVTQQGTGTDAYTPAAFASFGGFLAATGTPSFLIPIIESQALAPISFQDNNSATYRNISLKGGAEYDLTPTSLAYASFTTGFKSGGFNPDVSTSLVSNEFQPETLQAYALGSKNRFLQGGLQVNAEGFYWTYKNHQEIYLTPNQSDPAVSTPLTHNIGNATVKGFSTDIQYRPTDNDLFSAQFEYLDSTFNKFQYTELTAVGYEPATGCSTKGLGTTVVAGQTQQINAVNCDGKPFTRAPHFSINLSLQHTFPLGANNGDVVALITSHITSSQWLAVDYTPLEHERGLTVSDFNVTYEPANAWWSVTGYVRNLENTASYSSAFTYAFASNLVVGGINPPRTYGGVFKVRF